MPLTIGTQLGSLEITALLGKGGMGEVYRARDLNLKRDVAIKFLPDEFSRDGDRTSRFQREAEILASLNHPNIGAIYDLQEANSSRFLVLELVEGETLAERIARGPIALDEALNIARQIGDALEAAHEKGIIHRDLKPANVKVAPDGKVKVLDFGLAKAMETVPADVTLSNSPTMLTNTVGGMILGTAAYMSPEQARGKYVDKRTDIWAFGVVFHEMLTGRPAFLREDATSTLARVIEAEPSWEGVPPKVARLLKKCLEKDPRNRLRDIGDAWTLLEGTPPPPLSGRRFGSGAAWGAASVAIVIAAVLGFGWWRSSRPIEQPLVRLDVDLGEDVALFRNSSGNSIIISPDGMRLVYLSGLSGSEPKLFTRRLDEIRAIELPGTQGARSPFFSPDGKWIGFCAPQTSKISVEGGPVFPLLENTVCNSGSPSWSEDGTIAISGRGGMLIFPPGGSRDSAINQEGAVYPRVLPGGKAVLFTTLSRTPELDSAKSSIGVMTLADRKTKILAPGGTTARYAASGHLIYSSKSTLYAVPFDLNKLEPRGDPVAILDDVAYHRANGLAQFDISPAGHGTLIYWKGGAFGNDRNSGNVIQHVASSGKRQPLIDEPGSYNNLQLSPDGKRLIAIGAAFGDIWVYDLERGNIPTQLTSDRGYGSAIWGPNGRYVIFDSAKGLSWVRADGSSPAPQLLIPSENRPVPTSYTQIGKRLAYDTSRFTRPEIWTVSLEEQDGQLKAGQPERFLDDRLAGFMPVFSPDGRWLAYESLGQQASLSELSRGQGGGGGRGFRRGGEGSSDRELIVRPFPPPAAGQEQQVQISNKGSLPHWSQNGQDLVYQSGDQIMAVSYTVKANEFSAGKARVAWTNLSFGTGSSINSPWDLTPDGKGVVVSTRMDVPEPAKAEPVHTVVILQNFFDELKRRAPVGK